MLSLSPIAELAPPLPSPLCQSATGRRSSDETVLVDLPCGGLSSIHHFGGHSGRGGRGKALAGWPHQLVPVGQQRLLVPHPPPWPRAIAAATTGSSSLVVK